MIDKRTEIIATWLYGKAHNREYPEIELLLKMLWDNGFEITQRPQYSEDRTAHRPKSKRPDWRDETQMLDGDFHL